MEIINENNNNEDLTQHITEIREGEVVQEIQILNFPREQNFISYYRTNVFSFSFYFLITIILIFLKECLISNNDNNNINNNNGINNNDRINNDDTANDFYNQDLLHENNFDIFSSRKLTKLDAKENNYNFPTEAEMARAGNN